MCISSGGFVAKWISAFKIWPLKILLLLPTVTSASQVHPNRSHHDGCIPEGGPGGATAAPVAVYEKSTLSKQGEQGSSIIQHNMLEPPNNCQRINYECFLHSDIMYLISDAWIYTKLKHAQETKNRLWDLSQIYLNYIGLLPPIWIPWQRPSLKRPSAALQTHMVSICLSEATGQTRIRSSLWMQMQARLSPVFQPH